MNFNYKNLTKFSKILIAVTMLMLVAVLIPGIGVEVNFAQRWISLGPLRFQPSEIAKFTIVIYTASSITRKKDKIRSFFNGLLPYLIVLGIVTGLILKQPDLSTAVVIAGTVVLMLFAAGAKIKHFISIGLLSLPLLYFSIYGKEYRMRRLTSFLNPWEDSLDTGYHIIQSLYALGSGGLFGLGLGKSRQKFFYLPEPQTDFIFSVLGEELGFIGGLIIIILFMIFIWRGFRIAYRINDYFGSLLAMGITTWIALQSLINLAVVTATMPVTGVPLPFISFGGSSMLFTLSGVGILLNISRYTE